MTAADIILMSSAVGRIRTEASLAGFALFCCCSLRVQRFCFLGRTQGHNLFHAGPCTTRQAHDWFHRVQTSCHARCHRRALTRLLAPKVLRTSSFSLHIENNGDGFLLMPNKDAPHAVRTYRVSEGTQNGCFPRGVAMWVWWGVGGTSGCLPTDEENEE